MYKHLFIICIFYLFGCNGSNKKELNTTMQKSSLINLSDNVSTVNSLPLSEVALNVDFVSLELTDESIIGEISKVSVTDQDIWIKLSIDSYIYRFSRKGKFLNKVGKIGQGPEEYATLSDFLIDEQQDEVYIMSFDAGVKVYDLEGNYKRKASEVSLLDVFSANNQQYLLHNQSFFVFQNLCVTKPINNPKDSLWSIALINNNFTKKKIFKNPAHIGREEQIATNRSKDTGEMPNYWREDLTTIDLYGNKLSIKYPDTDTIYRYDETTASFTPEYSIYTKEKKGDYESTHLFIRERKALDYFAVNSYYESKDFIYLIGRKGENIYTYCFNKSDGKVREVRGKGEITERKLPWFSLPFLHMKTPFTLNNDLCGGEFTVAYRSAGKYWIDILEPWSDKNLTTINQLKNTIVKDEIKKKELINILNNISNEDNPVLIIATLK